MTACLLVVSPALAGEVELADGSIARGSVQRVTERSVEHGRYGGREYDFLPREKIQKILYDNGSVIPPGEEAGTLDGEAKNARAGSRAQRLYLEAEWGWNGYVGMGPRLDFRFFDSLSVNAGLGLGLWGQKLSAGLRYYMNYPHGAAFGVGVSYNTGGKLEMKMNTRDSSGVEQNETVEFNLRPVPVVNATVLYSWPAGKMGKMYLEAGYGFSLLRDHYSYSTDSGNELSGDSEDIMDAIQPGGVILSLGYAFAL